MHGIVLLEGTGFRNPNTTIVGQVQHSLYLLFLLHTQLMWGLVVINYLCFVLFDSDFTMQVFFVLIMLC
jgi:hypothetical protein